MKCPNCGAENSSNVKFCASCGHEISLSSKLVDKLDKGEFKSALGTAAGTAVNAVNKRIEDKKIKEEEEKRKQEEAKRLAEEKEKRQKEWAKNHWYLFVALIVILIGFIVLIAINTSKDIANHPNQVKAPNAIAVYKGDSFESVIADFKEAGFTNIKTEKITDLITGWVTKDGSVEQILINGDPDYSTSTWYLPNDEVVIRYHTFAEATSEESTTGTSMDEKSTEATTNDETINVAETGVYAYVSRTKEYKIYQIINLDKGEYYYFTDNEDTCERIKFEGGNLNDGIVLLFHDGDETFEENIHFKWKDKPEVLILQDAYGFEYTYYEIDLSDAKQASAGKQIIDR